MGLNQKEVTRYSRQICLREWGESRQQQLKDARVLVIGAGGLGSPALYYLAAAGVGHLGIAESDQVELSNLQRQILYGSNDIGSSKVDVARERLSELNPEIEIQTHPLRASDENIDKLIAPYDVVIDATDGFEARYSIHDACFRAKIPYVYGAVDRFEGRVAVFFHADGPCCRCLFPGSSSIVQNCAEAGVLGVLPGVIGTLQATETLKIISGVGEPLSGKLLIYDALSTSFRTFDVKKNPDCPLCGSQPKITRTRLPQSLSAQILREKLASGKSIRLIDVRERSEVASGKIDGAMNFPLGELAQHLQSLDHEQETVLYCQRGMRSAQALEIFRKAGFENTHHLEGGFHAYQQTFPGNIEL